MTKSDKNTNIAEEIEPVLRSDQLSKAIVYGGTDEDDDNSKESGVGEYKDEPPDELTDEEKFDLRLFRVRRKMLFITAMGSLGGFLAGYQSGVFTSAMIPIESVFYFTKDEKRVVLSSSIVSAILGSLVGGFLNKRFGRRKTIIIGAPTMAVGTKLQALGWNYVSMAAGRSFEGFGLGIIYLTVHMYVAEMSKPSERGRLVMIGAVMMHIGQWLAESIDKIIEKYFPVLGWRIMFGLACIPSLVILIGFIFLPESPRWFALQNQNDEALMVLKSIRLTDEEAKEELNSIYERTPGVYISSVSDDASTGDGSTESNKHRAPPEKSFGRLFCEMFADLGTRRALILSCGLFVLQILGGLNTVLYFGAFIYEQVGFTQPTAVWFSSFTPIVLIAGIFIASLVVDRIGRRRLGLVSLFLTGTSLIGLAGVFAQSLARSDQVTFAIGNCIVQNAGFWSGLNHNSLDCASISGCGFCGGVCTEGNVTGPFNTKHCPVGDWISSNVEIGSPNINGWIGLTLMMTYLFSYGVGLAGLPRLIDAEIYPLRYRSAATGFSNAVYWFCSLVANVTFISPGASSMLIYSETFWGYGTVSLIGFVWLCFVMPETKRVSMEDVEDLFRRNGKGNEPVNGEDGDDNDSESDFNRRHNGEGEEEEEEEDDDEEDNDGDESKLLSV